MKQRHKVRVHHSSSLLYILLSVLVACGGPAGDGSADQPHDIQTSRSTGSSGASETGTQQAGSAILTAPADSLQILYYDDPDGDSLRYARYYTYVATADTAVLGVFERVLKTPYTETPQRRPCRSEGKIYLFGKAEPLKTVYFSTRYHDGCRYLYVIRDGNFLYFDMGPELITVLEQQRSYALIP